MQNNTFKIRQVLYQEFALQIFKYLRDKSTQEVTILVESPFENEGLICSAGVAVPPWPFIQSSRHEAHPNSLIILYVTAFATLHWSPPRADARRPVVSDQSIQTKTLESSKEGIVLDWGRFSGRIGLWHTEEQLEMTTCIYNWAVNRCYFDFTAYLPLGGSDGS